MNAGFHSMLKDSCRYAIDMKIHVKNTGGQTYTLTRCDDVETELS